MGGRVGRSALLFVALFAVYSANGREIGAADTISTMMLPVTLIRGDGFHLNRYLEAARERDRLPVYATERGEGILSRYPLLPALIQLPLVAPQILLLDRVSPGWESDRAQVHWWLRQSAKNASAFLMALTGLLFYRLLLLLGLERSALPATLATFLGSTLWVVASQSPWQHGPAALFLILALLFLAIDPRAPWTIATSGAAAGLAVCARPTMLLFSGTLGVWALVSLRRRAVWFVVPAGLLVASLFAYNHHFFGHLLLGGQSEIAALQQARVERELEAQKRDPAEAAEMAAASARGPLGFPSPTLLHRAALGLMGTLVSPSRGLFLFSPWVLLVLLLLPMTARRLGGFPPLTALLWALLPFTYVVSAWPGWWAGWSFGPRFWTEVMPLFGVMLAFTLDELRARALRSLLYATIMLAIAIQTLGAFRYPSSWNGSPGSVDRLHYRLWDWRDTELTRCLVEGPPQPRNYPIFPDG